jgi:Protein of unknown function (DUF1348)
MLEFSARHSIAPITETFPMSKVNDAYEWHEDFGNCFRSYANENWEFDDGYYVSVKQNVVPGPLLDCAMSWPPWFLTIERLIERPRPMPLAFVV